MYNVKAGKLRFCVDENGRNAKWFSHETKAISPQTHDYFRVFLDNGMEKEIAVFSKEQTGKTEGVEDDICITFDTLTDEFGRTYDVRLKLFMKSVGDTMQCYSEIENNSDVRVNEVEFPFIELEKITNENFNEDVYYLSEGLGLRRKNPIAEIRRKHTEYMAGDYEHIWWSSRYPYHMSMAWYGVKSGDYFMYVGRHDEKFRTCVFSLGASPRGERDTLVFNISHFPVANKGEKLTLAKSVISLLKGSWKDGADIYKNWASSWYNPCEKKKWVQNFTGWQRIILKHQYGRIYFKYKDLVQVYENGKKYGLDTLMVFGWWKGRFDNGYPNYEPDEDLGGAQELKDAVAEIKRRGGHVILYNNGVLLDVTTDYYKTIGDKIEKKNIDGAPYRDYYRFSDYGMMLRTDGYKAFSLACHATDEWREKLIENAKIKLQFNPDSIFYDQLGGNPPLFCFNKNHKHGARVDEDATFKAQNVNAVRSILPKDVCIGTENVVDCISQTFDYIHGCHLASYCPNWGFPSLYRYVFPDTIVTNRFLHDDFDKFDNWFERSMNYAFVNGLRFDVSIYRGRKVDVASCPKYANYLKYLLDLKEEYKDFFYEGGTFIGDDTSIIKPYDTIANLYQNAKGEKILILWNDTTSNKNATVKAYCKKYSLAPNEFKIIRL